MKKKHLLAWLLALLPWTGGAQTVLFHTGDSTGYPYRIPAIATARNGQLVALSDRRPCGGDIGYGRVDILMRTSYDDGETWTPAVTVLEGTGRGATTGYGDACLVADRERNELLMVCASGDVPYWSSRPSHPLRMVYTRATYDKRGKTWRWDAPTDITGQIYFDVFGGRINGTLKMARANLKQVQSRYEIVKNQVVLNIKKAFTELLYAQHNAKLTQEVWALAQKWYAKPTGDLWTKIRIRALLADLTTSRNQAESELKKAQLGMLINLNKELNARITIKGDFEPVKTEWDLPHMSLWAMEFRPELKSAIYALEADNIAIDLALSKRYPDIILNASYEKLGVETLNDVNKQVSLAFRLPIPYTLTEQIAEKKASQQKSALRRSAIEDKIRVQVAESFENMLFWQKEVLDRQAAYEELNELLDQAAKDKPKTGTAPLEGLQDYLKTAQGYFQAVRNNHTAKAELEWAIGQDLE